MNIEDLISQYIDGTLSSEAEAELHHRLSISPEARQLFRAHIMLRGIARDQRVMHAPNQEMRARLFERLQREEGMGPTAETSPGASMPSSPSISSPSVPSSGRVPRSIPSATVRNVAVRRRRVMPWLIPLVIAGLMVFVLWNTDNDGEMTGGKNPTYANNGARSGAEGPSMAGEPVPDDMGPAVAGNPSAPQSSGSAGLTDQGTAEESVTSLSAYEQGSVEGESSGVISNSVGSSSASGSLGYSTPPASANSVRRDADRNLASSQPNRMMARNERSGNGAYRPRSFGSVTPPPSAPPSSVEGGGASSPEMADGLAQDLSNQRDNNGREMEPSRESRHQNRASVTSTFNKPQTKVGQTRSANDDELSTSARTQMSNAVTLNSAANTDRDAVKMERDNAGSPESKDAVLESEILTSRSDSTGYDLADDLKLPRHKAEPLSMSAPPPPPAPTTEQPSGVDFGSDNMQMAAADTPKGEGDLDNRSGKMAEEAPVEASSTMAEKRAVERKDGGAGNAAAKDIATKEATTREEAVSTVALSSEREGGGTMDSPLSPVRQSYRVMLLIGAHENSLVSLESTDLNFQVAVKVGVAYGPHQFYGMVGGGGYREVKSDSVTGVWTGGVFNPIANSTAVEDTATLFDELFGAVGYRYTFFVARDLIVGVGGWGGIGNRYSRFGGEIPVIYQINRWIRAEVIPGVQYARTRGSSSSREPIDGDPDGQSLIRTRRLERETDIQIGIGLGVTMIW